MPRRRPPERDRPNRNRRGRDRGRFFQDARRDVNLSMRPELNAIDREQSRLERDFDAMGGQVEGVYDALLNELQPLGGEFDTAAQGISSDYEAALAGLASQIGLSDMDTPDSETAAALGLFGASGAGSLGELAAGRQRNLGYQTSTQRQAGIQRQEASMNLMQDLEDALLGMSDRRMDVRSDMASRISQRSDELAEQALTRQLARSQMQSDQAFAEMMAGNVSSLLGGGGFGGGRGGGGGGRGGAGPSYPSTVNQRENFPDPRDDMSDRASNIMEAVNRIKGTTSWVDLPAWLRGLHENYQGPERWEQAVKNFGPRRRQVFRRTKPFVKSLFEEYS